MDEKIVLYFWNWLSCYPQNELSDVNKTYIDISNGQKFELYFFSKRFLTCKASCKFFSCSWLWPFWDMNSLLILTNSVSATSVWIDAFAISALSSCLSFINCSIFCSFSFRADFNLSGAKKIQANTLNQAKIIVSELVHPKSTILKIIWSHIVNLAMNLIS